MRNLGFIATLAMGTLLMPAAFAQTQSEAQPQPKVAGMNAMGVPAIAPEDQATAEQVERLYQVMRTRQQIESMLKQMSAMMNQQLSATLKKEADDLPEGKKISPEQLAARQQLIARFMDKSLHAYSAEEMLGALTPIYQKHISRSDVEALIAFFGSSAGQHMLEQQPLIMQEYLDTISKTMQDRIQSVTQEMKKELEDLSAKENADKPAAN